MKLLNLITRYGNTKELSFKTVGYKGNSGRNSIRNNYENNTICITYFNVDADGPSVSRTYPLEEPTPTKSDVRTDDGTMLFYQEPNLFFSDHGVFYYTEFADAGFWYAPYIPLQFCNRKLQTDPELDGIAPIKSRRPGPYANQPFADEKRAQMSSMFDDLANDNPPPPEPPAPPPRTVRY